MTTVNKNYTPLEIIKLYEQYQKDSNDLSTTLQKQNFKLETPNIKWHVVVTDVQNGNGEPYSYFINGKVYLYDSWAWLRGNRYHGEMTINAHIIGNDLKEFMLNIKRDQKVWIEGSVRYSARSFLIEPAKIIVSTIRQRR